LREERIKGEKKVEGERIKGEENWGRGKIETIKNGRERIGEERERRKERRKENEKELK